jgi:tryptophan synthase alpha chain
MSDRLTTAFQRKPAFMPYFPAGYPTIEASVDVIEALAKNGADLIEIGLPFSDPLADGPVIQQATQTALQNGATTRLVLDAVRELRRRGVTIPLILMGYCNPLYRFGLPDFCAESVSAGADGLIIPDLPPEESSALEQALSKQLPIIRMLAPTTSPDRAAAICRAAEGFLYLVSVSGVTGARDQLSADLPSFVARVRAAAPAGLPLCVGFGIGTPAQAAAVGAFTDGVIVGSACVRDIGTAADPPRAAAEFASAFRMALDPLRRKRA